MTEAERVRKELVQASEAARRRCHALTGAWCELQNHMTKLRSELTWRDRDAGRRLGLEDRLARDRQEQVFLESRMDAALAAWRDALAREAAHAEAIVPQRAFEFAR